MYHMHNYKKLTKAVIKIRIIITKATSFYVKSEYIAVRNSLKCHYFSPCLIHESCKGLCKLT